MSLIQRVLARLELSRDIRAKQYTPEEIAELHEITKTTAQKTYVIKHNSKTVVVDNVHGLGQVPWNQEVMYSGFVAFMKASTFLLLALNDEGAKDTSASRIVGWIEQGYSIGNPFLNIDMSSSPYYVMGHEGRARTKAMMKYFGGDILLPIHILMYSEKRRDLTTEKIEQFEAGNIAPQDEGNSIGPGHIKNII